jgi:hypothetical protein
LFKYLGTTIINQNFIQEEIKRRLNSGNDRVKEDEKCRACSTNVEKRNSYMILVGKPERKRSLRRPRRRRVDNIKRYLQEIGLGY